jgi:chromosomal replication initiator protein
MIYPTIAACVAAASEETGISILDIMSDRREGTCARARHLAMWVARNATTASLPVIGRVVGNRDHTTVAYGIKAIDRLREEDPETLIASDRALRRANNKAR